MRIEISGNRINFPPSCTCCDSKSDAVLTVSATKTSGEKVKRTQTNTWDFPYCMQCKEHVETSILASNSLLALCIASLIIGIFLGFTAGLWLGLVIGVVGFIGSFFLFFKLKADAEKLRTETCVSVNQAAEFVSWDGTCQEFEIVSQKYAQDFMIANKKKLINLSHQARTLLEGSGYAGEIRIVQSTRKYRSKTEDLS